jgi:hypothetical protein
LVTAGWLARRWRATARVWRLVLVALVAGLAVINATGVYAQLVAAQVGERGAAVAGLETRDAALAARIEVAAHTVADLDRHLAQIDSAIEEAAKRGKTNTALSAMEAQRKARAGFASERNEAAGTLPGRPQGRARQLSRRRPPHKGRLASGCNEDRDWRVRHARPACRRQGWRKGGTGAASDRSRGGRPTQIAGRT